MRRQKLKSTRRGACIGFACLPLLLASAGLLCGQQRASADAGTGSDSSQPVKRDYYFEVVSIRPGDPTGRISSRPGPSYTPGRFTSQSETIASLAYIAFEAKRDYEIECSPRIASSYFTINATLPEGATKADIDATGLPEEYDYTLTYTPEATTGKGVILSPLPPGAATGSAGDSEALAPLAHPLLRDALQEQLGLKLQPVKDVPIDVVVVDSANKEPTEN